jgi:glycosyltransferase 2 family protein
LIAVAVLLFWLFARNVEDWELVFSSLRKADSLLIALAVGIVCLGYLIRAVRWRVLLEPITQSSLKELFATTTVGFAAVFLVGRAGEIVRPMWLPLRDERVRPSAALVTIGIERIFDLASLIVFFAVNMLFLVRNPAREQDFAFWGYVSYLLLGGVVAGFAFLYLFYFASPRLIPAIDRFLRRIRIPMRLVGLITGLLGQLAAALSVLTDWKETVRVAFWTFILWLTILAPTWLVLIAFDLHLSLSAAVFVMGFASISSLIPTPGGAAGAFHLATAQAIVMLGVGREQAMASAIVMHLVYFAPAILFGIYYFLHGDMSLRKFKGLLSSEGAVEEIKSDAPDLVRE